MGDELDGIQFRAGRRAAWIRRHKARFPDVPASANRGRGTRQSRSRQLQIRDHRERTTIVNGHSRRLATSLSPSSNPAARIMNPTSGFSEVLYFVGVSDGI